MRANSVKSSYRALTSRQIDRRSNHSCRRKRRHAAIVWVVLFVSVQADSVGAICTQQPSREARTPGLVSQPVQRSLEVSGELGQDAERHYLRALPLQEAGDDARAEREFRDA